MKYETARCLFLWSVAACGFIFLSSKWMGFFRLSFWGSNFGKERSEKDEGYVGQNLH